MRNSLHGLTRGSAIGAAMIGATALILAGCGAPPETSGTESAAADNKDYTGCIVSDSGGFDDRSFNQSSYEGLKQAESELGIQIKQAESDAETDFGPNVNSMVQAGCDLTVTVGFLLGDVTKEVAEKNPESKFAIVDFQYEQPIENVKPIVYDTAQAAFLAGYLAAGTTKTGTVGTYGGIEIPTVTIFMDGFVDGVKHYNEEKGKNVKVLGWGESGSKSFVGDFSNQARGKQITENFINDGADIILPVAGPVGLGTLDAVKAANSAGKDVKVIWVDSDGYESVSTGKEFILSSVMKNMGESVRQVIADDVEGKFSNEPFIGTLENNGVALAPFHDLDAEVPADLKSELDKLKEDIISGAITVESDYSGK